MKTWIVEWLREWNRKCSLRWRYSDINVRELV